jgi:hypothetical protein
MLRANMVDFANGAADKAVRSTIEKGKSFEPWNRYELDWLRKRLVEEFLEWAAECFRLSPEKRQQLYSEITAIPEGQCANGVLITGPEIDELHDVGSIASYVWKALKDIGNIAKARRE